ncbi:exodeoxyribonuclease V alpha subunit [Marmoricola sp. URHA0025 HA25]
MTADRVTAPWADAHDRRRAVGATGLLRTFNESGILEAADVHVAQRLGRLAGEESPAVLLATALTVRAVRRGSICLDPRTIADLPLDEAPSAAPDGELPWPDPETWLEAIGASPLVTTQVLRLDQDLLYLDRYWREEVQVCDDLLGRFGLRPPEVDEEVLEAGLARIFPGDGYAEQRGAARAAARQWTTVLTGGPGTGKTTTVAGVLALVAEQHELATGDRPRIALAAPTGKAAARLQSAVQEAIGRFDPADRERLAGVRAVTVHSLLGSRMPRTSVRFRHNRNHRLPYDVVVVDEGSMLALSLAARLLEALRPQTRLLLVGDADQLSSVDAGAVLADLVAGLAERADSPVTRLVTTHRYGAGIDALAQALRDADADRVVEVLRGEGTGVVWIDPEDEEAMAALRADLHRRAVDLLDTARRGTAADAVAALDRHRLLCAHREGPYGVTGWNREIERLLAEGGEGYVYQEWYAGRPVLVTTNDRLLGLNNGDMGVTVFGEGADGVGRLRVVLPGPDGLQSFPTTRMPAVQTVFAMTIHKSQGSQADTVSVILPPEDSPLLTRELFYTAVTRAQQTVRVVGSEAAVRAAVSREVQRATGLRARLSSAT